MNSFRIILLKRIFRAENPINLKGKDGLIKNKEESA